VITAAQIGGMAIGGFLADSIGIRAKYLLNGTVVGISALIGLVILVVKRFEKAVQSDEAYF